MKRKRAGRLASLALCVMMTAASCLTAFADGGTIVLEECDNLEITLPDNMSAVTRTSESTDRYYTRHNLSYVDVQRAFLEGEIYLQAMDNDNNVTLTLSYLDTEAQDFDELSDEELSEVAGRFVGSISNEVQYNTSTQDQAGTEMPWIFFNLTVTDPEGNKTSQYQATTVENGKNITLTLYRNGGDVDPGDYQTLEAIARTVTLPGEPFYKNRMFWIIAGSALAFIIILIIIIAVSAKRAKNRKAQDKNDKILEELAGKYQSRQGGTAEDAADVEVDVNDSDYAAAPSKDKTYDDISDKGSLNKFADLYSSSAKAASKTSADKNGAQPEEQKKDFYGDSEPKPKYSDEEIERLLGTWEDRRNFDQTLPETQADSEQVSEVSDSVTEETPAAEDTAAEEAAEETGVTEGAAPDAEKIAASANTEDEIDISNISNISHISEGFEPEITATAEIEEETAEPNVVYEAPEPPVTAEEPFAEADIREEAADFAGYDTAEEQPEAFLIEDEQPCEAFPEEEDLPGEQPGDEENDFSAAFRERRHNSSFDAAEEIGNQKEAPKVSETEPEAEEALTKEPDSVQEKATAPVETVLIYKRPDKKRKNAESAEPASQKTEEEDKSPAEPSVEKAAKETAEATEAAETAEETEKSETGVESEENTAVSGDEDFEEYVQDEVLVREESRQERFKDSSDFFEEAPKRSFGIILSRDEDDEPQDLSTADDGDQTEDDEAAEETGASKPKKGVPEPVRKIGSGFRNIGGGVKSFGTHCGYFAKNVKREVTCSRMKKKRQKAAEERRREAELRGRQEPKPKKAVKPAQPERKATAQQPQTAKKSQESRRISNGLVQVHSRSDHAPVKRKQEDK